MRGPNSFRIRTVLPVDRDTVWAYASTPDGVNYELGPWVRMSFPAGFSDIGQAPLGTPTGVCTVSLLGLVPFDRHTLMFADVGPHGFVETSISLLNHYWYHERYVAEAEGGCELRDHVKVVPKLGFAAELVEAIAASVFLHRHKRLRLLYGG